MPCARMIRPMVSCMGGSVRVDDLDAYAATADRGDDLTQRLGGAPTTTDDRAEVLGVDPHLQPLTPPAVDEAYPDVVRVLDDALDEVLQRGAEHVSPPRRRRRQRPAPQSRPSAPRPRPSSPAGPSSPAWCPRPGPPRPWPRPRSAPGGPAARGRPSAARPAQAGP